MALKLFHSDPRGRAWQRFQVGLLLVLLPLALLSWQRAHSQWTAYCSAESLFEQGEQLLDHERLPESRRLFQAAVLAYPYHYAAWDALSTTYVAEHRTQLAADTLAMALCYLPREGRLHRELAQCYHELGDLESEARELDIAQRLMPEDLFTAQLIRRLGKCPVASRG